MAVSQFGLLAVIGWDDARNKGDEALIFGDGVPMDVCLCVLWRTLWRSSVAEWTCVHHRQHVGDALSGHLRAPGPCACLVLLTVQGRKTLRGCSFDRLRTVEASLAMLSSLVEDRRRSSVGLVMRGFVTDVSDGDSPLLVKVLGRLQSIEASLVSLTVLCWRTSS